jgi:single-strand DNA-binding protein
MPSLNRAEIIGFLGADPQQKTVGTGKLVTFSIATTDAWTDRNSQERRETTQWHSISVWNEAVGEIAMKYLKKGSQAYVEGKLETNKYTDSEGVERYATQVTIRPYNGQIILLDRPAEQPRQNRPSGPGGRR